MNDADDFRLNDPGQPAQGAHKTHVSAVGTPLPAGTGGKGQHLQDEEMKRSIPPLGRSLAPAENPQQSSGADRAMGILRLAVPFVQRILPILDSNFGTAVASALTHQQQPQPPSPPVDLEPVQTSLAELQTQHRDLRTQVVEQNTSLKRVEDQLEAVREATDRNTLEQQELLEDLKAVGSKVNLFALLALILLAGSVALNVILLLHIRRVLP